MHGSLNVKQGSPSEIYGRKVVLGLEISRGLQLVPANYRFNTALYFVIYLKKNEIGGACSTYGRQTRCMQGFGK